MHCTYLSRRRCISRDMVSTMCSACSRVGEEGDARPEEPKSLPMLFPPIFAPNFAKEINLRSSSFSNWRACRRRSSHWPPLIVTGIGRQWNEKTAFFTLQILNVILTWKKQKFRLIHKFIIQESRSLKFITGNWFIDIWTHLHWD